MGKHKTIAWVLTLLLAGACVAEAHPQARLHEADMEGVFARIEGEGFHETVARISRAIDNDLPKSFEERFGAIPGGRVGNHRLVGHGWTLDGKIPKEVLKELERACPGRRGEILQWWAGKATEYAKWMEDATHLPPKQAKALAGFHWDVHLLGDRMPDNTLVERVLPIGEIEANLEKNCEILFKGRPEYAKAIGKSLRRAMQQGGTQAEQAARLMETLQKEIPFSEMLSRCWHHPLGKGGIRIRPPTMESVRVESFLAKARVALPKTYATEARAKGGKVKGGKGGKGGGGKTAGTAGKTASKGLKGASRAAKAFGVGLPVAIEAGFFFYDEAKSREAFERGEQTWEETRCITYENMGRHGAALVLGVAGAWGGAEAGAAIGTGPAPGLGTAFGAGVGCVVGGIVGGIVGEIGGAAAGEMLYVAAAEKRAKEGDPDAQFFLGGYHFKRIKDGEEGHVKEALHYLSQVQVTRKGGFAKANVFLGKMAWDGIGQKANKRKAVRLWRAAAKLNDADAMYLLARAALAGEGMLQNVETGHAMMFEAAARGCEVALDEYPETEQIYRQWTAEKQKRDASIRRILWRGGMGLLTVAVVIMPTIVFWRKRKRAG